MKELEVCERACYEAGKIALKYFRGEYEIRKKGERDLVTQADIECEQRIKKVIAGEYATHAFLGEEGGRDGESKNVWVIDPIDGTTNFAHGIEQFCHSIALVREGQIVCGAIYNPVQKKLYSAYAGCGAKLNGNKIKVSTTDMLINSLLITGFPYNSPILEEKTLNAMFALRKRTQDLRRFGSACLDMCMVAEGLSEGFFEYKLNSWDVAAGILIVREAGGKVTDVNGREATIDSGNFLASNGILHEQIRAYLEGV